MDDVRRISPAKQVCGWPITTDWGRVTMVQEAIIVVGERRWRMHRVLVMSWRSEGYRHLSHLRRVRMSFIRRRIFFTRGTTALVTYRMNDRVSIRDNKFWPVKHVHQEHCSLTHSKLQRLSQRAT